MNAAEAGIQLPPAIAAREFRAHSAEQVVAHAISLGAAGIEWSQTHAPIGRPAVSECVKARTFDAGLKVAGYAAYWEGDPSLFIDIVNTAALLGAPTVRLGFAAMACLASRDLTSIRVALEIAEAARVTLSIAYFPASFEPTLRLTREIGHPALRIYWRARNAWKDLDSASSFHNLRFCVANVPLGELTQKNGIPHSEAVIRRRLLEPTGDPARYAIFDGAPNGVSLCRASKVGVSS